jgi:3-carboxy-cis,cis-muconate cycloisomerase
LPSDRDLDAETPLDVGLLSPVTAGHDQVVSDAAFLDALVTAELGLSAARASLTDDDADGFAAIGWQRGHIFRGHGLSAGALARAAVDGGNPVIPLVGRLRSRFDGAVGRDIHRGATSQDILDTALMLIATRVRRELVVTLSAIDAALVRIARDRRDQVAAARTLTQHAVPTTVGLRVANWLRGVRRARLRLDRLTLPAQLGGAGGTLAAFTVGADAVDPTTLPALFALELGLDVPDAPWHTTRWPMTELGDALVQIVDAMGVIATDVATLSRTEIAEMSEGSPGGSSAMPQKRNPTRSVLIRSAALRAPNLGATLHTAAALAGDERPDGAWHAEWPTLRELMRLVLGATANARTVLEDLRIDDAAVGRNLALTGEPLLAERASLEGGALGSSDPADYTGIAGVLVDRVVEDSP